MPEPFNRDDLIESIDDDVEFLEETIEMLNEDSGGLLEAIEVGSSEAGAAGSNQCERRYSDCDVSGWGAMQAPANLIMRSLMRGHG